MITDCLFTPPTWNCINWTPRHLRIQRSCKRINRLKTSLKVGKPTDEIVTAAEELNADLIVMSSSRISSLVHVLGSTARKVIDSTKRPVLIVHG